MRIRAVVQADFRTSDVTMFQRYVADNQAFVAALKPADIVVFVSKRGNQVLFIHGFTVIEAANDASRAVLSSNKHRLLTGSWNPLMLRNYAEEANLKVEGLRLYEQHYRRLTGEG